MCLTEWKLSPTFLCASSALTSRTALSITLLSPPSSFYLINADIYRLLPLAVCVLLGSMLLSLDPSFSTPEHLIVC